jgi:hypothetical protein
MVSSSLAPATPGKHFNRAFRISHLTQSQLIASNQNTNSLHGQLLLLEKRGKRLAEDAQFWLDMQITTTISGNKI